MEVAQLPMIENEHTYEGSGFKTSSYVCLLEQVNESKVLNPHQSETI